jgi:hypothetical protein
MALSLSAVSSNGVRQEVIDAVEQLRLRQELYGSVELTVDMTVHTRDAEYIVESLRVLLQGDKGMAERGWLYLDHDGISDAAIDVFARFLRETTMRSLYL